MTRTLIVLFALLTSPAQAARLASVAFTAGPTISTGPRARTRGCHIDPAAAFVNKAAYHTIIWTVTQNSHPVTDQVFPNPPGTFGNRLVASKEKAPSPGKALGPSNGKNTYMTYDIRDDGGSL
jgi:hypothetical protein